MTLLYAPAYSKTRISSIVKSKYYLQQISGLFYSEGCKVASPAILAGSLFPATCTTEIGVIEK